MKTFIPGRSVLREIRMLWRFASNADYVGFGFPAYIEDRETALRRHRRRR